MGGLGCMFLQLCLPSSLLPLFRELVPVDRLSCVRSFTKLFDSLATPENGVAPEEGEAYPVLVEMWFLFCVIWGIGGPLDEDGRKKFDAFMREMEPK